MLANVVVHPPGGYEKWVEAADRDRQQPAAGRARQARLREAGLQRLPHRRRHAEDRPDLEGSVRQDTRALEGGVSVTVDENYVRESILDPQAKVVAGFPPSMPRHEQLSDREITGSSNTSRR